MWSGEVLQHRVASKSSFSQVVKNFLSLPADEASETPAPTSNPVVALPESGFYDKNTEF